MGGSIGLAVKKRRLAKEVIGVFRHRSTLKRALSCRAIDKGVLKIKDGVKDADLIIVAAPVSSIPALAKEAIRYAKKGAILTDIGSTKSWIVGEVEKMLKKNSNVFFVGSHPMAGSEQTGVEFAKDNLLENAPCIVVNTARTGKQALNKVVNFWKSIGTRVEVMKPSEHDKSIAFVSHLPHLVAFSLAGAVPEKDLFYAAEGFKDTTRVASSDARLWSDIFLTNKKEVLNSVRVFEKYSKHIVKILSKGDQKALIRALSGIKAKRDKFFYEG